MSANDMLAPMLKNSMDQMIKIVNGETTHIYHGKCPSSKAGWRARDPKCPACQILSQLDTIATSIHKFGDVERGVEH